MQRTFTFQAHTLLDAFRGLNGLSPGAIERIEIDASRQPGVAVRLLADVDEGAVRQALRCVGDDGAFAAGTLRTGG